MVTRGEMLWLPASELGDPVVTFTPTDLAGLRLWLKADSLVLSDGDPVLTWADSSGNGNTVSQGTGSLWPIYKTAIVNSLPVVRVDGVDDVMGTASVAGTTWFSATAATIWAVYAQTNPAGYAIPFMWNQTAITNQAVAYAAYTDNVIYFDYGDSSGTARISGPQPSGWDGAFHVVEFYRSGTTMSITVDGAVIATSSTVTDALDFPGPLALAIGAGSAMDYAELLISNVAESAGNRAGMKSYLAAKYAITVV